MHAVVYQRLLAGEQTERSTRYYPGAPAARQAARRAIERARPGATMQATTRATAGGAWAPITDGDRVWRAAYATWPARISFQLTGATRVRGDQTATEIVRITVEPADIIDDAWQPFTAGNDASR